MLNGYILGPLFSEADIAQRKYEGSVLNKEFGKRVSWYNPIEAPINDKSTLPTAQDIFVGDTTEIGKADIIVADIANNDVGGAMELGIAFAMEYGSRVTKELFEKQDKMIRTRAKEYFAASGFKPKMVYAVCSDIRLKTAGSYDGIYIPVGWNQYVIGCLSSMGYKAKIFYSFDECVQALRTDLLDQ